MIDRKQALENLRKAKKKKPPKVKKPMRRISEKKQKEKVNERATFEADKEFYREIWVASPHRCTCGCNAKLGKEPLTTMFHHLLEKAQYPEYRHCPPNIMILHPDCHSAYHSNPLNRPEVMRRREIAEKECHTWNVYVINEEQ